ncbi:hypothetical protein MRB53_003397 [Persea americana]|uniref:Uncharacterized protein n=1 Tax=Persea americana TaxID=3435 RepID=A0ACC2MXD7_PERAE|nr:hypothetical protein MRB53_003397 [Persea americana]
MKIYSEFFIGFPKKEKRDKEEPRFRISFFFRPSFLFLPAVAVRGSALLCCAASLSPPHINLSFSLYSLSFCWTDGKNNNQAFFHLSSKAEVVSSLRTKRLFWG